MADTVKKGIVTQVIGDRGVVRAFGMGASLTPPLKVQKITVEIPAFTAHGESHGAIAVTVPHPRLAVGDTVAFCLFDDGTGLIIDKV